KIVPPETAALLNSLVVFFRSCVFHFILFFVIIRIVKCIFFDFVLIYFSFIDTRVAARRESENCKQRCNTHQFFHCRSLLLIFIRCHHFHLLYLHRLRHQYHPLPPDSGRLPFPGFPALLRLRCTPRVQAHQSALLPL